MKIKICFTLIISAIILISTGRIKGQNSLSQYKTTNLYFEFGGASILFSGNAERIIPVNEFINVSGRIGLGIYPSKIDIFGGESEISGIVPVTFSLLFGKQLLVETGLGLSVGWDDADDAYGNDGPIKWYTSIVGLRYHPSKNSYLFRIGYTPYIICQNKFDINGFIGVSIGGCLNCKKFK